MTAPFLPCSYFVVLTGAVGSGKSFQANALVKADVDGERVCAPMVWGLAEASAEGTAGEVLLDESACLVWPVVDCEDALRMVRACFPSTGPLTLGAARMALHKLQVDRAIAERVDPPPVPRPTPRDGEPLRAVVVDTATTLYRGSVATARRKLMAEAEAKGRGGKAGKQGAEYNDDRHLHGYAARVAKDLVDGLGALHRHRGLVVVVTVHTAPDYEIITTTGPDGRPEQKRVCVGEAPDLGSRGDVQAGLDVAPYSATWFQLAAKANTIWHCYASTPDFSRAVDADVNAESESFGSRHGVITRLGKYRYRGKVLWAKRQGGEGPLGIFASVPAVWHPDVPHGQPGVLASPDLGWVVTNAVRSLRAGGG